MQAQSVIREKPKRKGPIEALPASVEEWASYDCPDEIRDSFKQDSSSFALSCRNILAPVGNIFKMTFLKIETSIPIEPSGAKLHVTIKVGSSTGVKQQNKN